MPRPSKFNESKSESITLRVTTTAKRWMEDSLEDSVGDLLENLARDNLRITDSKGKNIPKLVKVPVALHHASAGASGVIEDDCIDEYLDVPKQWLKGDTEGSFIFPIRGDSMEPVIADGSMVLVNPNKSFSDGDICVVQHDYRLQCKIVSQNKQDKNSLLLTSYNEKYGISIVPKETVEHVWPVVWSFKQWA